MRLTTALNRILQLLEEMLRAVNLVVHLYIDEDDDGTTYVQALMVRNDRHLLAQSETVLPPQDQGAEPRDNRRTAAGALSDLAQKLTP